MTFGERHPGGDLKRCWPLAISLAVHALLVLAWLHFRGHVRVADDAPQPLSVLLLPRAVEPPAPAKPSGQASTANKHAPRKAAAASVPVEAVPSPTPQAEPAPATTAAPGAWAILDAAKQDIRKGGNAAGAARTGALQADSKWSRFENSVASAHVTRSPGPVTESYTAPDGQVYYRTRVGGQVTCRKSGSTGPPTPWNSEADIRAGAGRAATLDVANSAGDTLCPEGDRDWVRH